MSKQPAKLIISIAPSQSKGLILNPGDFCVARATQTPVMDAQIRRSLIQVEKDFDNSAFNFEIGKVYPLTSYTQMAIQIEEDKMKKAKNDADNYINSQ